MSSWAGWSRAWGKTRRRSRRRTRVRGPKFPGPDPLLADILADQGLFRIALERRGERGVVSDRPILPKLDNQQIWTGPGLCLLVLVISSNDPDLLRLLVAMGRDLLLAGNATTVPADE